VVLSFLTRFNPAETEFISCILVIAPILASRVILQQSVLACRLLPNSYAMFAGNDLG
jgi:hypothetical protein